MKKMNLVLQGKGGVGKSLVASMIAQYLIHHKREVSCIDLDPVNATLTSITSLNAEHLDVVQDEEINTRTFDEIIEKVSNTPNDFVIDSGASTYVPLGNYLISNNIPGLLSDIGCELTIHTVITGGQALMDTLTGCYNLIGKFPEPASFVIWLNPYWGGVRGGDKEFEQMKTYIDHQSRISQVVRIPQMKKETFGYDFQKMLERKQTFDDALNMSEIPIMTRQRLKMIQRNLFEQLEPILCQTDLTA